MGCAPGCSWSSATDDEDKVVCAAGELWIGPVVTLGLINLIGVGAHARYGDYAGFGIDFQFIPTVGPEDGNFSTFLFTANGRYYPFGGAFFIGGGFAFQSVSIEATIGDAKAAGTMSMPELMLGIGFMGRDGFIMGIDLALGIPLGGSDVSVDSNAASAAADEMARMNYMEAVQNLEDVGDKAIKVLAAPSSFRRRLRPRVRIALAGLQAGGASVTAVQPVADPGMSAQVELAGARG